jgi:hypothetical protein
VAVAVDDLEAHDSGYLNGCQPTPSMGLGVYGVGLAATRGAEAGDFAAGFALTGFLAGLAAVGFFGAFFGMLFFFVGFAMRGIYPTREAWSNR